MSLNCPSILNHVPELPKYLVLPFHSLLLAEHRESTFFISRVYLVLFPQPDGFHSPVPATRHHPAIFFICSDFITSQANFSSSGDSFALSNVGSHGLSLSFKKLRAGIPDILLTQLHLLRNLWANHLLFFRFILFSSSSFSFSWTSWTSSSWIFFDFFFFFFSVAS